MSSGFWSRWWWYYTVVGMLLIFSGVVIVRAQNNTIAENKAKAIVPVMEAPTCENHDLGETIAIVDDQTKPYLVFACKFPKPTRGDQTI